MTKIDSRKCPSPPADARCASPTPGTDRVPGKSFQGNVYSAKIDFFPPGLFAIIRQDEFPPFAESSAYRSFYPSSNCRGIFQLGAGRWLLHSGVEGPRADTA